MSIISKYDSLGNNRKNLIEDAIKCLENSEKEQVILKNEENKPKGFWGKINGFFNPFRCGKEV